MLTHSVNIYHTVPLRTFDKDLDDWLKVNTLEFDCSNPIISEGKVLTFTNDQGKFCTVRLANSDFVSITPIEEEEKD